MRNSIFSDREAIPNPWVGIDDASVRLISLGNFRPMLDNKPLTEVEMLQEIRIGAYNEHAALLKRAETEQARRMNNEEIEHKRDPVNRTLVLVLRIPPSHDVLEAAIRKKVEARKRLEAIKAASTSGSQPKKRGANLGELPVVDKRRKVGQEAICNEIISRANASGSTDLRRKSHHPAPYVCLYLPPSRS